MESTIVGLVNNAALLLALGLLYDAVGALRARAEGFLGRLITGLVLGSIGVAVMLNPWEFAPGVVFDSRSVLLGISGLFFGLVPTMTAMVMAAAFRLYTGGAGVWTGIGVIVTSGAIGLAWRRLFSRPAHARRMGELYALGLVVHAGMLLWMFTLPRPLPLDVLARISLPVMAIHPAGTALLGWMLASRAARWRDQEALKQSEARLRLALAAGRQGLYDLDLRTGVAQVNDEYARMLGYDPETLCETNEQWIARLHPDDRERAVEQYQAYLEGRIPEYRVDFRQRTRQGEWKWIESMGSIVERDEQGRPLRMLGTHVDITTRKEAELELERRNEFIQTILDHLPIGLAVNHVDQGTAIYMNDPFATIYGWPRDKLVDVSRFFELVYPDPAYRSEIQGRIMADIASGDPQRMRWEGISITRQDGEKRLVSAANIPIYEQDLMVSTVQDVTERVLAERALRQYAERLDILHEIDRAILTARSPVEIAQATLDLLRQRLSCARVSLATIDAGSQEARLAALSTAQGTRVAVETPIPLARFGGLSSFSQGQENVVADVRRTQAALDVDRALREEGILSYLNIPLIADGELLGSLNLAFDRVGALEPDQISIAREIADQLAIAYGQARLRAQLERRQRHLQRLTQRLVSLQEDERKRLSRELHDEAGQGLTALKIQLALAAASVPQEMDALRAGMQEALALVDATMEQIRGLARDLRPPALDAVGLNAALEGFCQDFAERAKITLSYTGVDLVLPDHLQIALYRAAQEALTNVARHAAATEVRVALERDEDGLLLSIRDNGRGFAAGETHIGIGLLGMRERLEAYQGALEIASRPGEGTRLSVRVPWKEER